MTDCLLILGTGALIPRHTWSPNPSHILIPSLAVLLPLMSIQEMEAAIFVVIFIFNVCPHT